MIIFPMICNAQGQITRTKPVPNKKIQKTSGKIDGHEWVDLGLPSGTKWATCNIGANTPEEIGMYLSWGETQEKKEYTPDNKLPVERVLFDRYYKTVRNYNIADTLWGRKWDMPTTRDFWELRTNCDIESITINNIDCFVFTGPNGNKLILPKTGYKDGSELKNINECHYWTEEINFEKNETLAKNASSYIFTNEGKNYIYNIGIYRGMCVRPVINWYYENK